MRRLEEEYQDRVDFHALNIDDLSSLELARQYQLTGIPLIVLLDASGNEVGRLLGYQTEDQLRAALEQLLAD